jgi:parvulin-like peptidyl-prolyl isomerase
MASQTPKAPLKNEPRDSKKGIKNPGIYAGTIVVLVIVVIAFVFVPMGGGSAAAISGNGRSLDFGSYAGKPIVYSQGSYMAIQVRDLTDRLRQQGLTEDNQLFAYQVYRGAFERTVIHEAAIDAVTKSGGAVTEAWLDTKVAESPTFQENGKFSAQKYHDATLSEKLNARNQIRDDTLYQSFFTDLLSVGPSSKETAFIKDMAKETRTIEYSAFPLSKYPDANVETWGKAHADLFRSLMLSRITIMTSEADAAKLLKNIQDKKTSFEDVAKASSKDAFGPKGGAEGAKYYYELAAELAGKGDADKLAALKVGDLSPVLKTTAGAWVFFKADAEIAPADISQGVVLAAVRSYLTSRERGVIEDWALAQAKALSSSGTSFEASAKKAGAAVKTVGPFPLNYGDLTISLYGQSAPLFKSIASANDPELSEASTSTKFLTAAFSLAPGAVSEPFVLGDNAIVLKVKDVGAAKDDETAPIGFYYPYFFQSGASTEVRDLFMKSPQLKDDFGKIFFKYFQPSTAAKKS